MPATCILYRDIGHTRHDRQVHLDKAVRLGEFHRIGQDIHNHLLQTIRIGQRAHGSNLSFVQDFDALVGQIGLHPVNRIRNNLVQIAKLEFQLQIRAFQPLCFQQIVDQLGQRGRILGRKFQQPVRLLGRGVPRLCESSCSDPLITVSGVRSSWLTVDRNWLCNRSDRIARSAAAFWTVTSIKDTAHPNSRWPRPNEIG